MIVDKIGVSQIQAQAKARPQARTTPLRFDAEPIEPIQPYKPPPRNATAGDSEGRAQAQRQDDRSGQSVETRDGVATATADAPKFSLAGQIPAETSTPDTVDSETYAGLPGDFLAQQFGANFDNGQSPVLSGGGRGLARQKGVGLYASVQQSTAAPTVQTRDDTDFWSDGIVLQRRNPINMYA